MTRNDLDKVVEIAKWIASDEHFQIMVSVADTSDPDFVEPRYMLVQLCWRLAEPGNLWLGNPQIVEFVLQ